MAEHTPGPWKIHDEQYCIDEIWGDLEGPIDGKIRGQHVCTLEQTDDGRICANACLIAAAPEMLAALRPFANYACDEPCGCHNCIARAVIKKATRF